MQISASVSCCYNDPVLEMPLEIGTIPLRDNVPVQNVPRVHPPGIEVNESTPLLSSNPIVQQPTSSQQQSHENNSTTLPGTSNGPLPYPDYGRVV